jgi:phosphoribosylformylglycinamidine synthase
VEASVIGEFTDTGRLEIFDKGQLVGDLEMRFLHKGTPRPVRRARFDAPRAGDPGVARCDDPAGLLLRLLGAPNLSSREWIVRQYDHEVQGTSVIKPLVGIHGDGPGDAAVIQPLAGSRRGLAIACGANPSYGLLDPYAMALCAIDEALRNAVAVGADPDQASILDNFSWGNCDKPDRMGAMVLTARGCHDAAIAYRTPFISGKDSLNNEYRVGGETLAIPPTLLITAIAPLPDIGRAQTMDLKRAGSLLYLVGRTRAEFGGSAYFELLGQSGGRVPRPELVLAPRLLRAVHGSLAHGLVLACHDLSEGGLAPAAAEMAFAGGLGLELELKQVEIWAPEPAEAAAADADTVALFSESPTRFLVEVAAENAREFEHRLEGLPFARVGRVLHEPVLRVLSRRGESWFEVPLERLRQAHHSGFAG